MFFVILTAAFAVGFILAIQHSNTAIIPVACILGLFISLFCSGVTNYNNCQKAKIEALNDAKIECVSEEHLYEMSKKEIDSLYKITTLKKTYYFKMPE